MDASDLRFAGAMNDKVYAGPAAVTIFLNCKCNHKCIFCFNPFIRRKSTIEEIGFMTDELKQLLEKELDYGIFKGLLRDMINMGVKTLVCSSHGETLLHSKFLQMLKDVKSSGLMLSILTNGSLITDEIIENLTPKHSLHINISSFKPEEYQRMHCAPRKNLRSTIKNIAKIASLKSPRPKIGLCKVLNYQNYGDIETYLKSAKILGADEVNFKWMQFFDCTDPHDLTIFPHKDRIQKVMMHLKETLGRLPQNTVKNNLNELYRATFAESRAPPSCLVGWYKAYVEVDGTVMTCCTSRDPVGNLNNNSFKEIWHSERYMKARALLKYSLHKKKGILGRCTRNCIFEDNLKIAEKIGSIRKL